MESEHINAGQELFLDGQETLVGAWKKTLEKNPERHFSLSMEKR